MQEGLAPTATDGPFKGRRMEMGRLQGYSSLSLLDNLDRVAFHPVGNPPSPEALAKGAAPLPDAAYAVRCLAVRPDGAAPAVERVHPDDPRCRDARLHARATPRPTLPAVESPAIRPEQVELHDVPFNDSLPLGGTRKLAVASDSGGVQLRVRDRRRA